MSGNDYTATSRNKKRREDLKKLGIKRRELYSHDKDWILVKEYSDQLLKIRLDKD